MHKFKTAATLTLIPMITAILLFSGCSTTRAVEKPSGPPTVADLFPLQQGNSWAYNYIDYQGGKEQRILVTTRVTRRDGKLVELKSGDNIINYRDDDLGVFKTQSRYYLLMSPVIEGKKWPLAGENGEVRISRTAQTVETPGGIFKNCVVVTEEIFGVSKVEWTYAPKVGPVKMKIFSLNADGEKLMAEGSLRAFQIAGAN